MTHFSISMEGKKTGGVGIFSINFNYYIVLLLEKYKGQGILR